MPIRRSFETAYQVPVQQVLGGGLDSGVRFLPHFAPDSWVSGQALIPSGATQLMFSNPGGSVGVRMARMFFAIQITTTSAAVPQLLNVQFSGGPTNIITMLYNSAVLGTVQPYTFDFLPFGLPPTDLTSNIQLNNQGTVAIEVAWMFMWGREPLASQPE